MDDTPEKQLMSKMIQCYQTVPNLKREYESLLQKQNSTDTAVDSNSGKQAPIVDDVPKQLQDIDLALESIQQQLKLDLEQYLHTQSALSTSVDRSTIQSDDNQMEVAKITINQQVELSDDTTGFNEATLNPTALEPQALINGTLPDDVYTHLMSVTGIQECLLSNRLVCSLWNNLVLERCKNQRSLKLFETFERLMEYGELLLAYEKADDTSLILKSIGDDLVFEGLETDHAQLVRSLNPGVILAPEKKLEASKVLTALFPKVDQLVLCPAYSTNINIKYLLQFYSEQLTSLTMTFRGVYDENSHDEDKNPGWQLRDLNFPKLKSLNTFNFSPEDAQLGSLLPQLESLTMRSAKMSLEALLRTGTQLRELNMDHFDSVYTAPVGDSSFSKRPRLVNKLRKFSITVRANDELNALGFISHNLTSLECLKLSFHDDYRGNLHSATSYLAPLHQLRSLTLDAPVSFFLLDDTQFAEIKPLPSVRQLKLILWDDDSLPMDLFSRALFAVFPNVEQILIAFAHSGRVDADTLAAFEAFAGRHTNIVQLFRSRDMSQFTAFPNAVSPLLGNRRQVYDDYIEEEELFGVAICKLTASLVTRPGEDGPNLKSTLRPANRLAAMSNFLQLLESGAFSFKSQLESPMIGCMINCALGCGPSQVAMFTVTCKCLLSLFGDSPFKNDRNCISVSVWDSFDNWSYLLRLVEHYQAQQFKEADLLLQIHHLMDKIILKTLNTHQFLCVLRALRGRNLVHRVEAARSLLRVCSSTKNIFRNF